MEGVLIIAALIGGVLLWQRVKSAASRQVSQKVLFRGTHAKGQEVVGTRLEFTAPNASARNVTQAVLARSALPTQPSSVKGSSWVKQRNDTQILIALGSKLTTSAQMLFNAEDDSAGQGSTGAFAVAKWTESDGLVMGHEEMARLKDLVHEAIKELDPDATFQLVPTK